MSPIPAIIFSCCLSVLLIATNTISTLIFFSAYAGVLGSAVAICAQIYLRLTRKNLNLPLGLPLFVPIIFLIFFLLVLVLPFTIPDKQLGVGMSFIIIASGIPVYFIFIWWEKKPKLFAKIDQFLLVVAQKLFDALPETFEPETIMKSD